MWRPRTKEALLREVRIREWRAQIWARFQNFLRWVAGNGMSGLSSLWGWLREQATMTAEEVEVNRLLSQRYDKLLSLGERVYSLYRAGALSTEALLPLCEEIARLDERLSHARKAPVHLLAETPPKAHNATGAP